ncbi:MAG: oligosaccharide flippase family protein [Solirubrobacteraceae bacterium]|nr:oligosaccharide flippase family protein [Solirubrobacteraceae bacterium]
MNADADEVKTRAVRSAIMVGGRTALVRGIGLLGNLALARMLTPDEFGQIAVGLVVITVAALFSDGGFGAALVRGSEEPDREDYETVAGFGVAMALAIVAAVFASALLGGHLAWIAAVMVLALPGAALRAPHAAYLERHLTYGPLVRVEVVEVVFNQTAAVVAVALGAGVWGVVGAVAIQPWIGALLLTLTSGLGVVAPVLHVARARAILPFGVRFQLLGLTGVALLQGLNVLVGVMGGLTALGYWSFASRLIQPAQQVFSTLRQVSFPGMARLRDAGASLAEVGHRAVGLIALATGFLLVPIAASSPDLIEVVFGARWTPTAEVFTLSLVALLLSGPVSTAYLGVLLAEGFASVILRIALIQLVVWLGVVVATYSSLGIEAVGAGAICAGLADLSFYRWWAPRLTDLDFSISPVLVPFVSALVAIYGTQALVRESGIAEHALLAAVLAVAVSSAAYAALAATTQRHNLRSLTTVLRTRAFNLA